MKYYTVDMLREAITLAQSHKKHSNLDIQSLGLWELNEIIKYLDNKYNIKDTWSREPSNDTVKLAIDYKVNSTEELNKILKGIK